MNVPSEIQWPLISECPSSRHLDFLLHSTYTNKADAILSISAHITHFTERLFTNTQI